MAYVEYPGIMSEVEERANRGVDVVSTAVNAKDNLMKKQTKYG